MNRQLKLTTYFSSQQNNKEEKLGNAEFDIEEDDNNKVIKQENIGNAELDIEEDNSKKVIKQENGTVNKIREVNGQIFEYELFKQELLTWQKPLEKFLEKKQFRNIYDFIVQEYKGKTVYPLFDKIFNAFQLTSFQNLKVVIVGQDPYINENQAMGLSFSVPRNEKKLPPSLLNIFKAIQQDLGQGNVKVGKHGDLTKWAQQGVLLLNGILTVEQGKSNSHKNAGWSQFTDHVIQIINDQCHSIVFILWGNPSQLKAKNVDHQKHFILKACHPSPLSAYKGNFFESKHFSKTNEYLQSVQKKVIDWDLD